MTNYGVYWGQIYFPFLRQIDLFAHHTGTILSPDSCGGNTFPGSLLMVAAKRQ